MMYAYIHSFIHVYTPILIFSCTHILTSIYIYIFTYSYIHIDTFVLIYSQNHLQCKVFHVVQVMEFTKHCKVLGFSGVSGFSAHSWVRPNEGHAEEWVEKPEKPELLLCFVNSRT